MARSTLLWLLLPCCLTTLALSQMVIGAKQDGTYVSSQSGSVVQVVYVIDGTTLTTYNIDPQTLLANVVGTITLPEANSANITASPNDHFIYYTSYDPSALTRHLWVYATDATGSPQEPPGQELNADKFYGFLAFDPRTNFAYQVTAVPTGGGEYENYTIWRYLVNPNTGRITYPQAEAKYKLPSGAGGSEYCGLFIVGFNATGTKMYDEVGCSYHDGDSGTYNERSLNLKTGALGADVEVYTSYNSSGSSDSVQLANNLVFDLAMVNDYQLGSNSVNVYPLQPNAGATPLVECTASMLEACGYFSGLDLVHPSGKYVFLEITSGTTQIEKVETSAHKIVDTSNYIPYTVERFSPDGTIAFGVQSENTAFNLEIYGIDVTTGMVTPGGAIYVPSGLDPWFTAERY